VIAFLAHKFAYKTVPRVLFDAFHFNSRNLPPEEPIDLLNVAFENPRSLQGNAHPSKSHGLKRVPEKVVVSEHQKYLVPDRVTGLAQVEEFRRLAPQRTWNFVGMVRLLSDFESHQFISGGNRHPLRGEPSSPLLFSVMLNDAGINPFPSHHRAANGTSQNGDGSCMFLLPIVQKVVDCLCSLLPRHCISLHVALAR